MLGINPGGEVQGVGIECPDEQFHPRWLGRLLPAAEFRALPRPKGARRIR